MSGFEVKNLGLIDYVEAYTQMLHHYQTAEKTRQDEIWCLEHPPVFTQGRHGSLDHQYNLHNIPLAASDRGGQITYHGPGQAIIYFLLDLKQHNIGIKALVNCIEQMCIDQLAQYGIKSYTVKSAPGIYTDHKKIASLGLRVRNGKTYHGLAINTDMELAPFSYIDPCGYHGLEMTQISAFFPKITLDQVFSDYTKGFIFNYFSINT